MLRVEKSLRDVTEASFFPTDTPVRIGAKGDTATMKGTGKGITWLRLYFMFMY